MSDYIDALLAKGKEKLKGPEGKAALKFLKDHKKELDGVGKDLLSRLMSYVGMGEPEKAKDLYLILKQSPDELIQGVAASGDAFLKAHDKAVKDAEQARAMWQKLGEEAAKALLPFIVAML